mgnify:CR=1 FL=1
MKLSILALLLSAGFHDAHEHVLDAALFPSACAEEYAGSSEEDCVAHMVAFAKTHPGSSWLLSHGWRDNLWNPPVAPTRASLDNAFPYRPVAMYSGDGHTVWTNSKGLAKLGLTDESEPPVGGSYDRDEAGHLTGVLREAAGMELWPPFWVRSPQRNLSRSMRHTSTTQCPWYYRCL